MKLSTIVAEFLARRGVTHAFLVQGAANNDLIYSIADTPGIDYVCTMHEQAAGFAAEGWARVKGLPGVAIATSGPGGQNLVTPLANCFYESVPAIFITGQVHRDFLSKSPEVRQLGFQETPIHEICAPITKWSRRVMEADSIQWALEQAWHIARSGRPGPVLLDLPLDLQKAEGDPPAPPSERYEPNADKRVPLDELGLLMSDLRRSRRPVLLVGGGAWGADVCGLAARLGCPAFPTWNALDVVPSDSPWYGGRVGTYGGPGRNFGIQNADLVLAIGCRISGRITGSRPDTFARGAKIWSVNTDWSLGVPGWHPVRRAKVVNCDAAHFVSVLKASLQAPADCAGWLEQCRAWRDQYDPVRDAIARDGESETPHPYVFASMLSELCDRNAIVITDCGGNVVTMNHAFRTRAGQRFFSNNGNSPMGFSMCGALGAWFAAPDRQVIAVIGDGGFNMNVQELQTLVNYGAKVKTFILDNHVYGITKAYQRTNMGGRYEACGPVGYRPPNFHHLCAAYGIYSVVCRRPDFMGAAIRMTLEHDGPAVCIVDCPEYSTYEPRISGYGTPIEDMDPRLPREEFRANLVGVDPLAGWETGDYA